MNQSPGNATHEWIRGIVEHYEKPLIRYAQRVLGDSERARDVVQDTFLQLCRQPKEKLGDNVTAWLYRVCRNRALDVCKKESRMSHVSDPETTAIESREPDQLQQLESLETALSAKQLLNKLPDQQQEVIRLKVAHELSYREISDITGLTVSNVGYLLHTGLKSLREQFTG